MNTYYKSIIFLFLIILTSCEDVIDVDLQDAPSRLVIEASIDWEKGTTGNNQTISLRTSTTYFDTETNTGVLDASVKVTNNDSNEEFVFIHQSNGDYTTTTFIPVINNSYTLEVIYEGETYTAIETLFPLVDVDDITQSTEEGFEDDLLEVNIIFTDPADQENYYLFRIQEQGDLLPFLEIGDDEFVNGNELSWWIEKGEDEDTDELEAFQPNDTVNINFFSISEGYYNYLEILIDQSEGAGLFSSTPVPLKGNCFNTTNPDNYAFGYFRLTEVVNISYTFN